MKNTNVNSSSTQEIFPFVETVSFLRSSKQPSGKPDVETLQLIPYSRILFPFRIIIYLILYLSNGLFPSDVKVQ
jgi:hypothetical protein